LTFYTRRETETVFARSLGFWNSDFRSSQAVGVTSDANLRKDKELEQFIDLSGGFDFEVPFTNLKFAARGTWGENKL
jgi:hypothetical protein